MVSRRPRLKGLPSTRSCPGRGRGRGLLFRGTRAEAPPCPVCDAGRWSCHRRFVRATTPPQWSPARDTFPSAGLSSPNACRQGGTHSGTVRTGRGSKGGSRGGTTGIRGAGLVFGKSGMALPATLSLTPDAHPVNLTMGALRAHASQVIRHGVRSRFSPRASARIHSYNELTSPMRAS